MLLATIFYWAMWWAGLASAAEPPSSACSALLSSGLKDRYQSSNSGVSESQAHSAFCSVDVGMSYNQYQEGQRTGMSNSNSWNAAASFSYAGFGAGASYGESHAVSNEKDFSNLQTFLTSYQHTFCASSYDQQYNEAASAQFSSVMPPGAFEAYNKCLEMYKAGMRVTQTDGTDATSTSLDLVFSSGIAGSVATLSAITVYPAGSAVCRVFGLGHALQTDGSSPIERIVLEQDAVYTVFCALTEATVCGGSAQPNRTDVTVVTSPGGTYQVVLKRRPTPTYMQMLEQRLTQLEQRVDFRSGELTFCPGCNNVLGGEGWSDSINVTFQPPFSSRPTFFLTSKHWDITSQSRTLRTGLRWEVEELSGDGAVVRLYAPVGSLYIATYVWLALGSPGMSIAATPQGPPTPAVVPVACPQYDFEDPSNYGFNTGPASFLDRQPVFCRYGGAVREFRLDMVGEAWMHTLYSCCSGGAPYGVSLVPTRKETTWSSGTNADDVRLLTPLMPVDCGDGFVLQSFNLVNKESNYGTFHYEYWCRPIATGGACVERQTNWATELFPSVKMLGFLWLVCESPTPLMRGFALEVEGQSARYRYTCCGPP